MDGGVAGHPSALQWWAGGGLTVTMWSTATLDAVRNDADAETVMGTVQRDVRLYIDRRRAWRLTMRRSTTSSP